MPFLFLCPVGDTALIIAIFEESLEGACTLVENNATTINVDFGMYDLSQKVTLHQKMIFVDYRVKCFT